jgi:cytochrome P450
MNAMSQQFSSPADRKAGCPFDPTAIAATDRPSAAIGALSGKALRSAPAVKGTPPGPNGLPILGSLLDIRRNVLGFLENCARQYGDVVHFRLGAWPAFLLSDPKHIEQVLVKEHQNFIKHRFAWRQVTGIFGNGLVMSEGEFWRRQRRLAAPAFAGQRLATYGPAMVRYTDRMLDTWEPSEPRNLHADMMTLTVEIAAKTLFNADVEHEVAEIASAMNALTREISPRLTRPIVIPDGVPLPSNIRYRRALRSMEHVVGRIIGERKSHPKDTGDLLSMLMSGRDENGQPMSDRQLRDEALTLLFAGHETTALALSWTGYLLGQYPEIDARLATEVHDVLGDRDATVEDLPRLPFTEHVITEAMRLYPPAWAIGREALHACEIGGYRVAAGTTIIMSPWVVHHDARHFENPIEFRPDRWEGDLAQQLPRYAYFPFGGGPRVCIGNRFAMMEAMLILVTIVQRFRLTWQRGQPVQPFASLTLRPKHGVWVTPTARTVASNMCR